MIGDTCHAWRLVLRGLARQPGFTAAAVVAIALGVGGATTVASLAEGVLLRPYLYRDADRLVLVTARDPGRGTTPVAPSIAEYLDLRERTRSFEALGSFVTLAYNLPGDGTTPALPLHVNFVSASVLSTLGVAPHFGRIFTHPEEMPGDDLHSVVLSHDLWQRRFGGDTSVIGRRVRLDTTPYTVIGVMPPGFRFGYAFAANADAWAPLESWLARYDETMRGQPRDGRAYYNVLGRLAPGVSLVQARGELSRFGDDLAGRFPSTNRDVSFTATGLREAESGAITPYLRLVAAAVVLLLAMACTNVAGLLLVRAAARRAEVAARLALGAPRAAIVRQWLIEAMVLGLVGGLLGVLLAAYAVQAIDLAIPVTRPVWMTFGLHWPVALGAAVLGLATGLVFGLAPAWVSAQVPVADALRASGRSGAAPVDRVRRALVAAQVAVACLLLTTGGVLLRTLWHVSGTPIGLTADRLLAAYVSPPGDKYREEDDLPAYASYYRRVIERVRALPEVEAVGGLDVLPFDGQDMPSEGRVLTREGDTVESQRGTPSVVMARASHDVFAIAGIPLLQGRTFTEGDDRRSARVALVSRSLATRFWPGADAIGQRVKAGAADEPGEWYTVIGVVGDVRLHGAAREPLPVLYRPYTQIAAGDLHFVVRTRAGDPATVADLVGRTIADVDRDVAVYRVQPLSARLADARWQARLWTFVCGVFAVVALLLAAIGVYSVTATSVAHRRREFGVRAALGARPRDIVALVQREVAAVVGVGLAVGLTAAMLMLPRAADLLVGVVPRDPLTLAATAAVVVVAGVVAGWLPARRAGRADPAETLRTAPW